MVMLWVPSQYDWNSLGIELWLWKVFIDPALIKYLEHNIESCRHNANARVQIWNDMVTQWRSL